MMGPELTAGKPSNVRLRWEGAIPVHPAGTGLAGDTWPGHPRHVREPSPARVRFQPRGRRELERHLPAGAAGPPGQTQPAGGQLPAQGQDPGLGAGTAPVRTGSPRLASPGTAPGSLTERRQTDSNVSTHGQLTDTAAPLTRVSRHSCHACVGAQRLVGAGGEERAAFLLALPGPPPAHARPQHPPGPVQQRPAPAPTHAGSSMRLCHAQGDPEPQERWARLRSRAAPGAAARAPEQPLARQEPTPPYLLYGPAPPAVLALGSLRKDKKEEEELKSTTIIATVAARSHCCLLIDGQRARIRARTRVPPPQAHGETRPG